MAALKFEVQQSVGTITGNFESIKTQTIESLKEYEGSVFTETSKTLAKVIIADLRKRKKEIDDSRKAVKTQWMEPYYAFEEKVKELTTLIDTTIEHIDKQVKEMETVRIAKKKQEIAAVYEGLAEDMKDYLPLNKIYDTKWENITVRMPAIKKEIEESVCRTRSDLTVIKNMNSEAVKKAIELYKSSLNLASAITYINNYETQRLEILKLEEQKNRADEERRRGVEIRRIREEEREWVAREQNIRKETIEELKTVDDESAAPLISGESIRAIYTIVATKEELEELETAITSLGIYFERKDIG